MTYSTDTSCGFSPTPLIEIPTVGTFRLGWDDFEASRTTGEGQLVIKSGRFKTQIEPGHWAFTVKLYQQPESILESLRAYAVESINQFLATGLGSITVNTPAHQYKSCYLKSVTPSKSYIDYDLVERVEEISLVLIDPKNSLV